MLKDTGDEHMDDPEGLWRTKGYVVSHAVVDASQAARLRDICDDVLEQGNAGNGHTECGCDQIVESPQKARAFGPCVTGGVR